MKSALILVLLFLTLAACSRKKESQCVAGAGGDVTIVLYANHNGTKILNYDGHPDTAFVKYNATTSPGTSPSAYDTYFIGEGGEDHIHCKNLKCGSYFIYRIAFDSITNTRYTGGISVTITQTAGEIDTTAIVN